MRLEDRGGDGSKLFFDTVGRTDGAGSCEGTPAVRET
jgi:hypothetical protein